MDTKQVLFCVSIFAILSDVIVFTEHRSVYGNPCTNSIRLLCFISATDNTTLQQNKVTNSKQDFSFPQMTRLKFKSNVQPRHSVGLSACKSIFAN